MRKAAAGLLALLVCLVPAATLATADDAPEESEDDDTEPESEDEGKWEEIGAVDNGAAEETGGGEGARDEGVVTLRCDDTPARVSRTGSYILDGNRLNYIDGMAFRISLATGQVWQQMYRTCHYSNGTSGSRYVWVTVVDPPPEVLIPGTVDEVTERVYAPTPALSPTSRGVVNLGMWLAVAEPPENPVVARASASPTSWAETSATLRTTTFDFGNGDEITCAGVGDPIPERAKDSVDPSPVCGYTYLDHNDGEPYSLTMTSTWSVVSTTSRGTTVVQPDIVLSTTIDYPVIEIQTIGTSG